MNDTVDWKAFLARHGYYAASFALTGLQPTLPELRVWMQTDKPRYTGWAPFWWPTRSTIAPRVVEQDTFDCLHDGTGPTKHIERWRASTAGEFSIVRAYDSDYDEPGKYLELVLPAWRVAELLLYAGRMAARFESVTVDFTVRYEGLAGRVLRATTSPNRLLVGHYTTDAPRYERRVVLSAADIETGVVEMTGDLIRGLFDLFQFTIPATLADEEITRMRSNRF